MGEAVDAVAVLQATYRTDADERTWLRGILEATASSSRAVFGYTYVTHPRRGLEVASLSEAGTIFPSWRSVLVPLLNAAPPRVVDAFFRQHRPVRWALRGTTGSRRAWVTRIVEATDCADVLLVMRTDPSGAGVLVGFPFSSGEPLKVPPRTLHRLGCIASHINAARRLRQALGRPWHEARIEAVLSTDGRVLHLEGPLKKDKRGRELLARANATRGRVYARELPPDEAIREWRALIGGRWSLVDHVESDGRRLVLARRNDPRVREPRVLNGRERTIAALAATGRHNVEIAYELGLSPTTVATHLTSALTKLGVSSRAELIRAFGPVFE